MAKKKDEPENKAPRLSKSEFLYNVLSKDVNDILAYYKGDQKIEITEHIIALFDELQDHVVTGGFDALQKFTNREVDILKKFRSAFKFYETKKFANLFNVSNVLLNKGYYSPEEFKMLSASEKNLTVQEIKEVCYALDNLLNASLYSSYLEEDQETEMVEIISEKEDDDKDMTEARRLLAIHYLFKATLGIEHRSHGDVSAYARFAHLLLGKKITKLQDSSIYKKYKKLPNFNKGQQLIKDLYYIKPFFQALNLQTAVDLIEKEIETENNEPKM